MGGCQGVDEIEVEALFHMPGEAHDGAGEAREARVDGGGIFQRPLEELGVRAVGHEVAALSERALVGEQLAARGEGHVGAGEQAFFNFAGEGAHAGHGRDLVGAVIDHHALIQSADQGLAREHVERDPQDRVLEAQAGRGLADRLAQPALVVGVDGLEDAAVRQLAHGHHRGRVEDPQVALGLPGVGRGLGPGRQLLAHGRLAEALDDRDRVELVVHEQDPVLLRQLAHQVVAAGLERVIPVHHRDADDVVAFERAHETPPDSVEIQSVRQRSPVRLRRTDQDG
ncbi:hypothetical protein D3C72_1045640 [compost metagenome]